MRVSESKAYLEAYVPPGPEAAHAEPPAAVQRARDHAEAARHAFVSYRDEKTIRDGRPVEEVDYFIYEATELAAYAEMQGTQATVAFRGTLVDSCANWRVDANCLTRGDPRRHRGFFDGWNALKPKIYKWLEERQPKTIVLTGHSLGGAMALLAAYDLAERWLIDGVTVFGCPRAGTPGFARSYEARLAGPGASTTLGNITTRYVMGTDAVPRVPPPLLFLHVGPATYINEQGNRISAPMPFAARVFESAVPVPRPDAPPPLSVDAGLLVFVQSLAPLAGGGASPFWRTATLFSLLMGVTLHRDSLMHAAAKYLLALGSRQVMIEREPALAATI